MFEVVGVFGAGEAERGEAVADALVLWGGPLAQAEVSGAGIFGAVAVEDLLILS